VTGGLAPAFAAARTRLGLIALLFALAAACWWWTVNEMQGMDGGPWTDLGTLGWFVGVWVVMMAAMMFPSVAPTVALYSKMSRKPLASAYFVTGYLLTWTGADARPGGHPVRRSMRSPTSTARSSLRTRCRRR
jgi:hypothetical protein